MYKYKYLYIYIWLWIALGSLCVCSCLQGLAPLFGLIFVRRKIASLFADCADIKRIAFRKCGAVRVLWFDIFASFELSPVFWQPRILGIAFVLEDFGIGLVFVVTSSLSPKGFALWTPTMGLLAPLTPRQSSRALQPLLLTRAYHLFGKRNKVGSWRSQLLGNSAKPTFHASLDPALLNFTLNFVQSSTFIPRSKFQQTLF